MIVFLDVFSFVLSIVNTFTLYQILKVFFPVRGRRPVRMLAFFLLMQIANVIIYANDPVNVLVVLLGFFVYLLVFYQGTLIQKLSIVMVLYPMLVSVNYLTQDIGMRIFFAQSDQSILVSTIIHTMSLAARPLLWYLIWLICRRWTQSIMELLNIKMCLLLDSVCIASLASLLVVLNFMPDNILISYPVGLACMITVFGSLYLVEYIAESVKTTFQLDALRMRYEYYEDKRKEEQRVRSIYHDMKNHLLLLQADVNNEQAGEMITSLQEQILGYENYHKTGNEFLDVVVRDKAEKARSQKIDFSVMLHFEDGSFLEPLDISTIFGNALDNAIEASTKLPVSQRLITAKANRVRDMLSVVIENNFAEPPDSAPKTSKKDAFLHGFGRGNIQKAVEKYGGKCSANHEHGRFSLKIIIPIP